MDEFRAFVIPQPPLSPYLPDEELPFREHVLGNADEWIRFVRAAHEYMGRAVNNLEGMKAAGAQLDRELRLERKERVKTETLHNQELLKKTAVIAYQEELLSKAHQKVIDISKERDRAIQLATPTVSTPMSDPVRGAEKLPDTVPGTPPTSVTASTESSRLSEKLPDPDKFEGERSALRRFVSLIHE